MVVDIIIIAIVAAGFISGMIQGFIVQVGMLAGLFLAVWGARAYTPVLGGYIERFFDISDAYLPVLSFIACFLLILFACYLVLSFLRKCFHLIALGWIDHIGGALVGTVKSVLLLGVIAFVLNVSGFESRLIPQDQMERSTLYAPLKTIVPFVFMNKSAQEYWDMLKGKTHDDPATKNVI